MREKAITVLLLIVALIHLTPAVGFLGVAQLQTLYGIDIASSDLELLMRHRAILFGILGCLFAWAAFRPAYQAQTFAIALATILPFLYLVLAAEKVGESILGIMRADLVALACLLIAMLLFYLPVAPLAAEPSRS